MQTPRASMGLLVPMMLALGPLVKAVVLISPGSFPMLTGWLKAFATAGVMLFASGALSAWCNMPWIILDVTRLPKRP